MRAAVKQLDSSRAGCQGPPVVLMLRMGRVSHKRRVTPHFWLQWSDPQWCESAGIGGGYLIAAGL